MVDIKKLIQEKGLELKFEGVAPDGFVLVHEKTLEDLKKYSIWSKWVNDEININELNKNNFDNT